MAISSDKGKIIVNSIKARQSTNICMNGKCWKKWASSNTLDPHIPKAGTSVKEVKLRLAQAHSAMTRFAISWVTCLVNTALWMM